MADEELITPSHNTDLPEEVLKGLTSSTVTYCKSVYMLFGDINQVSRR